MVVLFPVDNATRVAVGWLLGFQSTRYSDMDLRCAVNDPLFWRQTQCSGGRTGDRPLDTVDCMVGSTSIEQAVGTGGLLRDQVCDLGCRPLSRSRCVRRLKVVKPLA